MKNTDKDFLVSMIKHELVELSKRCSEYALYVPEDDITYFSGNSFSINPRKELISTSLKIDDILILVGKYENIND